MSNRVELIINTIVYSKQKEIKKIDGNHYEILVDDDTKIKVSVLNSCIMLSLFVYDSRIDQDIVRKYSRYYNILSETLKERISDKKAI